MKRNVAIVYLSCACAWLISLVVALGITLANGTLGSILGGWFACAVALVLLLGGATTAEYYMLKEYE